MAASATLTTIPAQGHANGLLAALLQTAINFLARSEKTSVVQEVSADDAGQVDLWKLYRAAGASDSVSPKVRALLSTAAE